MGGPSGGNTLIALVGNLIADVVAYPVERMPEMERLHKVNRIFLHLGGSVANTGKTLARLGVPVLVAGRVGKDALGYFVERALKDFAHQVEVEQGGDYTSATMVFIRPDGGRGFLFALGACTGLGPEVIRPQVWRALGVRAIHIGYLNLLPRFEAEPLAEVLTDARSYGILVSGDVAYDPSSPWERVLAILPYLDLFMPNLDEARALTGKEQPEEAAHALLEFGVKQAVAVKLGPEGCYLATQDGFTLRLSGHPVPVLDSTGAGDAFIAGFLAAWYRGLAWEEALRMANATGALAVTGLGAAEGVSDWATVARLAGLS